jgi:type II secretory pathway component HofQ
VTQQVQGLEGSPSFISVGSSVPVATTTRGPGGTVTTTTGFQQIDTGFQVVPRVAGDRVFLDILPQRATPGGFGPGSANVQRIATTVSGRLGEWIPLGGVAVESSAQTAGIASRGSTSSAATSGVWVRVEEIK